MLILLIINNHCCLHDFSFIFIYIFPCSIELDYAVVELILARLPTERFKRNVVRGKLDLVGKYPDPIYLSFFIPFSSSNEGSKKGIEGNA